MNPFVLLLVGSIFAGFGAAVLLKGYRAAKQSLYPSTNLRIASGAVLLGAGLTCMFFAVLVAVMS
jgi:hypothetical protein